MKQPTPKTLEIEGETVTYVKKGRSSSWRCGCTDFQRRLEKFGQGFCAHTAVAMMRETLVKP